MATNKTNKKVTNIVYDDGTREFSVNGSEETIKMSLADANLPKRWIEAWEELEKEQAKMEEYDLTPNGEADTENIEKYNKVVEFEKLVREKMNYVFDAEVDEIAFGRRSCLTPVGGVPIFIRFYQAVTPIIEETYKTELSATESTQKVQKYSGNAKYKKATGKR